MRRSPVMNRESHLLPIRATLTAILVSIYCAHSIPRRLTFLVGQRRATFALARAENTEKVVTS